MKDGGWVADRWYSWRQACGQSLLHVVAQLAEFFSLNTDPGLVLGRDALDLLAPLLGLARMALFSGLLDLLAVGCDAGSEFRQEGAGLGTGDEATQVAHRAAAHGMGLQPAGQFVQERLRLIATVLQQLAGCIPFRRQHFFWKDQITTTGLQDRRIRLARGILWLY